MSALSELLLGTPQPPQPEPELTLATHAVMRCCAEVAARMVRVAALTRKLVAQNELARGVTGCRQDP